MPKYVVPLLVGFAVFLVVAVGLSAMGDGSGLIKGFSLMPATFLGIFVAYIMANLVGTKLTPKASAEQRQAALSLRPEPGKALLIVFREGFVGMAAGMNVRLDGADLAQLKSPRFTAVSIAPGGHDLSMGMGGLAAAQSNATMARFNAVEGDVVVFRATMSMGALKNAINIERIDNHADLAQRLGKMQMVEPQV